MAKSKSQSSPFKPLTIEQMFPPNEPPPPLPQRILPATPKISPAFSKQQSSGLFTPQIGLNVGLDRHG